MIEKDLYIKEYYDMGIKIIDDIPNSYVRKTSEKIRDDLNEAIRKRIKSFELVGDYNYTRLREQVVYQAALIYREYFYDDYTRRVRKQVYDETGEVIFLFASDYAHKAFTVRSRTEPDRKHVYVSINYEYIDDLYNILLADGRSQAEKHKANRRD